MASQSHIYTSKFVIDWVGRVTFETFCIWTILKRLAKTFTSCRVHFKKKCDIGVYISNGFSSSRCDHVSDTKRKSFDITIKKKIVWNCTHQHHQRYNFLVSDLIIYLLNALIAICQSVAVWQCLWNSAWEIEINRLEMHFHELQPNPHEFYDTTTNTAKQMQHLSLMWI